MTDPRRPRLSRRGLLIGGVVGTGAAVGGGYAVEQDWLPGRVWAYEHLGLNGPDGEVPDIVPGSISTGGFTTPHMPGREVGWAVVLPPDVGPRGLPVVIALHPLGADHTWAIDVGIDRFLAAAVADGVTPFAIVTVDGGTGYFHPHDGEDAGAMVHDDLLQAVTADPTFADLDLTRLGMIGWSMGGYGVLHLAPSIGTEGVRAVAAASPAVWSDPNEASSSGFASTEEYDDYTVFGHQESLVGTDIRIDCGKGDPFLHDVEDYVAGFAVPVEAVYAPGGHDRGYWRRILPDQLAFLGHALT
ncbi:esterase family protein [Nocardioides humilatus]|uniref:Acyl-CoA:diacylglycerol acyltransferase n=1 Tax=Nocardioides humilatus TaxID=2607660 RepID=A0A5B1L5H5_9ACTN|nr:alpha/beta hydrolase-fold protein [Nocardioides humilatus]KAA1415408.1 esterase family protein [Nocardioides humilatus]